MESIPLGEFLRQHPNEAKVLLKNRELDAEV